MPALLRARPLSFFLLLLLLNRSSVLHLTPSPRLIICLLIPTHCVLYDPLLLTIRATPLPLFLKFDHHSPWQHVLFGNIKTSFHPIGADVFMFAYVIMSARGCFACLLGSV